MAISVQTHNRQKKETFAFTPADIDAASNFTADGLMQFGVSHKDTLRTHLSIEEILLNWQATANDDARFTIEIYPRFCRIALRISYIGAPNNPTERVEDELFGSNDFGRSVLENLGLSLSWQYQNNCNVVYCSLKKERKLSQLNMVLLAILSATLISGCSFLLPQIWRDFILFSFINPLFNSFLKAVSCVVGPMMFLSMIWGIINIGDTRQLGLIGKKIFTQFMIISTLFGVLCMAASILVFRPSFSNEKSGMTIIQSVIEMLLDIIPPNIVEPFLSGNTMQILFLSTVVGIVIIISRDRMAVMTQVVEQANIIVQTILGVISGLIPVFIFLSVIRLILQGTFTQNAAGLLVVILLSTVLLLIEIVLESLSLMRIGIPLSQIIKNLGPAFLICLTTASSAAAFPTMIDTFENKLGIDKKLVNFVLPFGSVVFMPQAVNIYITVSVFAMQVYDVKMSIGSAVSFLLTAVFLAVATPPIPGGGLTSFTLLFMYLNLPLEAISLAVAANVVLDFTATAGNIFALEAQLIHGARHLNIIDKDTLFSKQ